jgi:Trypsin-like peptidase domain/Effector-associated domain 1
MPALNLTGPQRKALSDALGNAFPLKRLRELLDYRLDTRLDDVTLGDDYQQIRFELIRDAEARGWTAELLVAARAENPGNSHLLAIGEQLDGGAVASLAQERVIREQSPFFEVVEWRRRMGELEGQVCRVEVLVGAATAYGTGFLVAPDTVITNHHVIGPALAGTALASDVVFRFDYKVLQGNLIGSGTTFGLRDDDWLLDSSPLADVDLEPDPKSREPSAEELDYALLRLNGAPGADAIGKGDEQSPARGFIDLSAPQQGVAAGSPLFILQHPDSRPLQLALEMDGVIDVVATGTRIRHRVNTEGGSSGSPCFNAHWELVGIHHVGDPNFAHEAAFNEAISIDSIMTLLAQRGKAAEVLTAGV